MQSRVPLLDLATRVAAEAAQQRGDVWAAFLAGSVGKGEVSYYTDLDIWYLVTSLQRGFAGWGHEQREGVYVAPTVHAQIDFSSLERLDQNPVYKLSLTESVVLYDPTGELSRLQASARADLRDHGKHRALVARMLDRNLQQWQEQAAPSPFFGNPTVTTLERVNIFLNSVFCALTMQTPTRRRRLVRMQETAAALGVPGLYALVLAIHGVEGVTLADARALFDNALAVDSALDDALANRRIDLKSMGLNSRDVIDWDREYLRRGVQDLLFEGRHHNAAFLAAHWSDKAHHAMERSGPVTPAAEDAYRQILDRLGYSRAEEVAAKQLLIDEYIRRIQALVDVGLTSAPP